MRKTKLWLLLLAGLGASSCGGGFQPFVGLTSGKHRIFAVPVKAYEYNFENIGNGSIGGNCIPNTSGVYDYDVGKKVYGSGSTCGIAYLPAKWQPGMTMRIYWEVFPYPHWLPREAASGHGRFDEDDIGIINQYDEFYSTEIPLPPPPPSAGDNFGKASNVTVHFLACNQIFITYGYKEEGKQTALHMKLFEKSRKLCTPRPSIKFMADYYRNKAKMDAIKEERKHIPQVILPEYIKQLEAEGKIPVSSK